MWHRFAAVGVFVTWCAESVPGSSTPQRIEHRTGNAAVDSSSVRWNRRSTSHPAASVCVTLSTDQVLDEGLASPTDTFTVRTIAVDAG